MSALGPRGRVWVAFVVLIAVVGALVTPASASPFDEPVAECSEDRVVFAMNFKAGARGSGVYVDLPQGVYKVHLYTSARSVQWDSWSVVSVFGWNAQGGFVSETSRDRKSWMISKWPEVVDSDGLAFSRPIPLPGGVAQVGMYLSEDVAAQATRWRWEIIAPGVCRMASHAGSDDLMSE